MPCFAVLMSVYLSYLSCDLCIKIQVQSDSYIKKRGLNALCIPSLLLELLNFLKMSVINVKEKELFYHIHYSPARALVYFRPTELGVSATVNCSTTEERPVRTSANWGISKPGFLGASEKPYPGKPKATT